MKKMVAILFILGFLMWGCDGKRGRDGITGPTGDFGADGRAGTDGCDFGEVKNSDTGECELDPGYIPFEPDRLCRIPGEIWNYELEGGCIDDPTL